MNTTLYAATTLSMLCCGIVLADQDTDDPVKRDRQQIEGTWLITKLVVNGKTVSREDTSKLIVVNGSDGSWTLRSGEQEISRGTSTFDPSKKPKTIDFMATVGPSKGQVQFGIYALGKETRKVCFSAVGKPRPEAFESTEGSEIVLAEFRRVASP